MHSIFHSIMHCAVLCRGCTVCCAAAGLSWDLNPILHPFRKNDPIIRLWNQAHASIFVWSMDGVFLRLLRHFFTVKKCPWLRDNLLYIEYYVLRFAATHTLLPVETYNGCACGSTAVYLSDWWKLLIDGQKYVFKVL